MDRRYTRKIHGRTMWCDLPIWVWFDRENEEWFAEVLSDDERASARTDGHPSQEGAESELCGWLTAIAKKAGA